ncbi:hypothetical protein K3495_g5647 [Podosphaera aphanis]|nr:hypothetical protein K3495_g5647 [Podosphaera aphanis]
MLNDEDRLLPPIESNVQRKTYLKWMIQNSRFEFNLSPLVSALENTENKDAKILGDCLNKNFNCIGEEMDNMYDDGNYLQKDQERLAKELGSANLRVEKLEELNQLREL